jgi:hypothetical protein
MDLLNRRKKVCPLFDFLVSEQERKKIDREKERMKDGRKEGNK